MKVSELYRHLRDLNDSLWATLALVHSQSMRKAIPSFILPSLNDTLALAEISKIGTQAQGGPRIVAECAEMRRKMMLNLHEAESSEARREMAINKAQIQVVKNMQKAWTG
jgi:hypothetical protein